MKEIFICQDKTMTFDRFLSEFKGKVMIDKDDEQVYFENNYVKAGCLKLRSLHCLISNCNPGY